MGNSLSNGERHVFSETLISKIDKPTGEVKGMDFLRDLWGFMRVRKKFWLLPIILALLLLGILMVFTSGSAIAPFIYTIF